MRPILIVLSILSFSSLNAQFYRVFFNEKGEDLPVSTDYLEVVRSHCDSLWMHSNWLNYALVENKTEPVILFNFDFVERIEKVVPLASIPLQENEKKVDTTALDKHRQWQLDTMGFQFFQKNKLSGAGITIAIIDAGFTKADESRAFQHIYADHRVLRTYDFIDNDSNVYHGSHHGTSVWSLIGGSLDGKPIGLAPQASFILLRSEDSQTETMADEDRWIMAIEKAYEWGADIVSSSIGFSNVLHKRADLNGQTLISKAADMAAKKGMLVVISAGNEWVTAWKTLSVPADADGAIAVGGIDKEGKQSYFSSVGPTADGRAKPDVVAPGTCVAVKGNELYLGSGTSFAAPLVTGYLACMMEWKGKGNFTKDSVKHYGGLYPYFDYVYGYGVPKVYAESSYRNFTFGLSYQVDKINYRITPFSPDHFKKMKKIFLKIEGTDGVIKFSKIIQINNSKGYQIPVTKKQNFFLRNKYFNPNKSDTWTIWWNGSYVFY